MMGVSRVLRTLIGFNGAAQPRGAQASCLVATGAPGPARATPQECQSFSFSEGAVAPSAAHPFVIHSDAQVCTF